MTTQPLALRRQTGRIVWATGGILLLLMVSAVIHLGLGARLVAPRTVVAALLAFDPRNFEHQIIVNLRLLRLVAALLDWTRVG